MREECAVCFDKCQLAHLFAPGRTRYGLQSVCPHPVCMDCAVRISLNNSTCPQCREPFTHVRQYTNPLLEYEVATRSLLPGLTDCSHIEMSVAVSLIFNYNERGGYDVFIPEYIQGIYGMETEIFKKMPIVINTAGGIRELKAAKFEEMRGLVHDVRNYPLIFTRVMIARCVMYMLERCNLFDIEGMCLCHTCLERREHERVTTRPTDPREDEGGSKLFLFSTS
jgi:hypothetical protein